MEDIQVVDLVMVVFMEVDHIVLVHHIIDQ